MEPKDAATLLANTSLFSTLDDKTLFRLAERAVERDVAKGEVIVRENDPGDSLFVVVDGMFKVFVTSEHGDEMALVALKPPDVFGELALIDGGTRSASAEALEPGKVLVLSRPTLMEIMQESETLADALLKTLGSLVRRLTEQASDLVFLDLHGRVAKLLLSLVDKHGTRQDDSILLDLHMTQSDLARMVGGSRQAVNQTLRLFEQRGYISVQGRQVLILDEDRLARRAAR